MVTLSFKVRVWLFSPFSAYQTVRSWCIHHILRHSGCPTSTGHGGPDGAWKGKNKHPHRLIPHTGLLCLSQIKTRVMQLLKSLWRKRLITTLISIVGTQITYKLMDFKIRFACCLISNTYLLKGSNFPRTSRHTRRFDKTWERSGCVQVTGICVWCHNSNQTQTGRKGSPHWIQRCSCKWAEELKLALANLNAGFH